MWDQTIQFIIQPALGVHTMAISRPAISFPLGGRRILRRTK
jgi:hypothetical protein